jgi:hypothetical protein
MSNSNQGIKKDPTGSDQLTTKYLGEVVDVMDPLREGRCKVRVFSIFDALPVEDIPWAIQSQKPAFFGQDARAGSISIPKKGAIVNVRFNNGDLYSPEYEQAQELGEDILEELKKSSDFEYEGAHFLLWDGDQKIKMYFNKTRGLTFEMKDSYINIDQNSKIEIYHKDGLSSVELDGNVITVQSQSQVNVISNSIKTTAQSVHIDGKATRLGSSNVVESAVMGDSLYACLVSLAAMLDAKIPSTAGAAVELVTNFRDTILSETVSVGH